MLELSDAARRLRPIALLAAVTIPLWLATLVAAQGGGVQRVERPALDKGGAVLEVASPDGAQSYDLAALEAIGLYRITTRSQWDQVSPTFDGVLLSDLLEHAGLGEAAAVELTAADDYSLVIPREDWIDYPVLVATRQDDKLLRDDERGPLRIVYPLSYYPELDSDDYHARWVWSLKQIKEAKP